MSKDAEIVVGDNSLTITADAFFDSQGQLRLWHERGVPTHRHGKIDVELPLNYMIRERFGHTPRLKITIEEA